MGPIFKNSYLCQNFTEVYEIKNTYIWWQYLTTQQISKESEKSCTCGGNLHFSYPLTLGRNFDNFNILNGDSFHNKLQNFCKLAHNIRT